MNILVIRVDGREEMHTVTRGQAMPAIERLIGATVLDTVNLRDGRVMLVDDIGHDANKPDNPKATALYHGICKPGTTHRIVGDVAIAKDEDFA